MSLQILSSVQLPITPKNYHNDSDDSPQDCAFTQEGSSCTEATVPSIVMSPFSLSFHDKEKVYALVQWKLRNSTSDHMNIITSANNVLSKKIPDNVVMTTILSYAGSRQQIYFLLMSMAKCTQQFVLKHQEKLAPHFVEFQPIVERYVNADKKCIQNYDRGIVRRNQLGPLKYDKKTYTDNTITRQRPRVTFDNQTEYEGERDLDGRRHGFGTQLDRFGFLYEGQFKANKMHGFGRQIQPNGTYYVGKWNDQERHGKGYQLFIDGSVYEGQWRENKIHGVGKMTFTDGTYYDGKWRKGYKHGEGIIKLPNKKVKEGVWDLGKLQYWLSGDE